MVELDILTDHQIQDYVDGRLEPRDQAAVAAYLLAHPDVASRVETMRRQSEALQGIGREILDEPVPERLRMVLQSQTETSAGAGRSFFRPSGFLAAAAAIVLLCLGGGFGWFMNEQLSARLSLENLIASNAADAYSFYGGEGGYPFDFPPDRTAELVSWISRAFEREIPPPDLADLSYEYQGGRLLPISGARTALFQFRDSEGDRLAVFFWPAERQPTNVDRIGRQENVAARYWLDGGLSFAVMSDESNPDLESVAEAVFAFYDGTLGVE